MADDADKPDKPLDESETLVNALESIKSLLATSEEKLNKARESVSLASSSSLKMTQDVPVLDEVIIPGKPLESGKTPSTAPPRKTSSKSTANKDKNRFKAELEQEMCDKLAAYAKELEKELKAKISDYLDKT